MKQLIAVIYILVSASALFPLPPPPDLKELVARSDYIARTRIHSVTSNKLTSESMAVNADAEILTVYKTSGAFPKNFKLGFIIFTEKFGKWLREPPPEGEYIIFYIRKELKNGKYAIALYEPHPYAFREFSPELENSIRELTGQK